MGLGFLYGFWGLGFNRGLGFRVWGCHGCMAAKTNRCCKCYPRLYRGSTGLRC